MNPLTLLKNAVAAVPAVKYALGVAGIAAAVAIVLGLKLNPQVAVFGTLIVLGLMFILLIFARFSGQKENPEILQPAKVLVWFYTVIIMVVTCLFISSYFLRWPLNFNSEKVHAEEKLQSGSATVFNAYPNHYGQSTFIFDGAQVSNWGDKEADLGVSNPTPNEPAMFFLMNNMPPYTDPKAANQDPANAGIVDMHTRSIDDVNEAPITGYKGTYFTPTASHVYCVRTRDGRHFAKIVVTEIDDDRIIFDYGFQPNGSRDLRTHPE